MCENELSQEFSANQTYEEDLEKDLEVISSSKVVKLMMLELAKVKDIVQLPDNQLRKLLTKWKWDTQVFLDKFFAGMCDDSSNNKADLSRPKPLQENVQIGVRGKRKNPKPITGPVRKSMRRAAANSKLQPPLPDLPPPICCGICLDVCLESDMIKMICCQNLYCKPCIKQYVITTIENSSVIDSISCPGFKCDNLVSDEIVSGMLDSSMLKKYHKLIANGFVANNRLIKWCSNSGCTRALKVSAAENQPAVRCVCGFVQCFQCSQEIHDLIPCQLLKKFKDVKAQHIETSNWLVANSKPCPKCFSDIEKNGGCHHMTCRQCHYQFCWICGNNWNLHLTCKPSEIDKFKAGSLRRLVNCNNQYTTMKQSHALDKKMYKSQLKEQDLEIKEQWYKIDFVKEAVEILLNSRLTLADSYIFRYFFSDENDTQIIRFVLNQKDLTNATEDLSHVLETQINGENFHKMKLLIQNKTSICKGRHRALFDHVKEGFQNVSWKITPTGQA